MDQNSSSATPPQTDNNPLPDASLPTQTVAQPSITPQNEPIVPQQVPDPITNQPQSASQIDSSTDNSSEKANYIDDVGYSLISLLDQINSDEKLIQVVAHEMRLDTENVKSILAPLLDKIDQGQITLEELALITAAPVVDEPSDIT